MGFGLNSNLLKVFKGIQAEGGRAVIVGGWVRDKIIGITPKDIDVEVFGLSFPTLCNLLTEYGEIETVGESFGVTKLYLDGETIDFSIPRRECKQGKGHRGFDVEFDQNMSFKEASSRRDFTINSMGFDPLTLEILDPYNGQHDSVGIILSNSAEKLLVLLRY